MPPHREVGARVPGVNETGGTEAGDQRLGFRGTFEVVARGRGDDLVEQSQMRGDSFGHGLIGGGGEHDAPAFGAFSADVVQQGLVVGQQRRIAGREVRHTRLEPGPAGGKRTEDGARVHGAQKRDHPLHQRVGADQRAVEIDAKRQQFCRGRLERGGDDIRVRRSCEKTRHSVANSVAGIRGVGIRGDHATATARNHMEPIDITAYRRCKARYVAPVTDGI
jgi:hypothetical protein